VGPSAPFKAFLDDTSGRWMDRRWKDKLAAGFTNSAGMSGDKLGTLQALNLVPMQHGMVGGPRSPAGKQHQLRFAGRPEPARAALRWRVRDGLLSDV
jgi:multimeric flavodoxin WrbA